MLKQKKKIFYANGILQHKDDVKRKWNYYDPSYVAWKEGKTGYPLVDANMREMKATGFMSNRGRQNVASFLALDLQYDWRYGADWFESNLVDYDVYSNWVVRNFVSTFCWHDMFIVVVHVHDLASVANDLFCLSTRFRIGVPRRD